MDSKLKTEMKNNKNWIHNPEKLTQGHVVYLIKFLGDITVDESKGLEVVKQSVKKLQFNQELKKAAESNFKTGKAELTISVNGVTIQDPKTQKVLYEYSLDNISYYVDDKVEKQGFFSFISSNATTETCNCFVFLSNKLAKDVTLTMAQAFDLAYKNLKNSKPSSEALNILLKKIEILEHENKELKTRMKAIAAIKGNNDQLKQYMKRKEIVDLCTVKPNLTQTNIEPIQDEQPMPENQLENSVNDNDNTSEELICFDVMNSSLDEVYDNDFDPRAWESGSSTSTPNEPVSMPSGFQDPAAPDFFGMASFSAPTTTKTNLYPALNDLNPFQKL